MGTTHILTVAGISKEEEKMSAAARRLEGRKMRRLVMEMVDQELLALFVVGCAGLCVDEWFLVQKRNYKPKTYVERDVDVFVCGDHGRSFHSFQLFVSSCLRKLLDLNHRIVHCVKYKQTQVYLSLPAWVICIRVEGLENDIHFFQVSQNESLLDVLEGGRLMIFPMVFDFVRRDFITDAWVGSNRRDERHEEYAE
jgi:hypothetical protein